MSSLAKNDGATDSQHGGQPNNGPPLQFGSVAAQMGRTGPGVAPPPGGAEAQFAQTIVRTQSAPPSMEEQQQAMPNFIPEKSGNVQQQAHMKQQHHFKPQQQQQQQQQQHPHHVMQAAPHFQQAPQFYPAPGGIPPFVRPIVPPYPMHAGYVYHQQPQPVQQPPPQRRSKIVITNPDSGAVVDLPAKQPRKSSQEQPPPQAQNPSQSQSAPQGQNASQPQQQHQQQQQQQQHPSHHLQQGHPSQQGQHMPPQQGQHHHHPQHPQPGGAPGQQGQGAYPARGPPVTYSGGAPVMYAPPMATPPAMSIHAAPYTPSMGASYGVHGANPQMKGVHPPQGHQPQQAVVERFSLPPEPATDAKPDDEHKDKAPQAQAPGQVGAGRGRGGRNSQSKEQPKWQKRGSAEDHPRKGSDSAKDQLKEASKPAEKEAPKPAEKEAPKPAEKEAPKPAEKEAPKPAEKEEAEKPAAKVVTPKVTEAKAVEPEAPKVTAPKVEAKAAPVESKPAPKVASPRATKAKAPEAAAPAPAKPAPVETKVEQSTPRSDSGMLPTPTKLRTGASPRSSLTKPVDAPSSPKALVPGVTDYASTKPLIAASPKAEKREEKADAEKPTAAAAVVTANVTIDSDSNKKIYSTAYLRELQTRPRCMERPLNIPTEVVLPLPGQGGPVPGPNRESWQKTPFPAGNQGGGGPRQSGSGPPGMGGPRQMPNMPQRQGSFDRPGPPGFQNMGGPGMMQPPQGQGNFGRNQGNNMMGNQGNFGRNNNNNMQAPAFGTRTQGPRQTPQHNHHQQKGAPTIPESMVKPLVKTDTAWKPVAGTDEDKVYKKVKSILNKLTIEKFDTLLEQVLAIQMPSVDVLRGIIHIIFDKALAEQGFSTMYADLCAQLSRSANLPSFAQEGSGKSQSFKRLLLNRCQEQFEHKGALPDDYEELDKEGKYQAERKIRLRQLGNIKFIGELYKKGMLNEKIMHECIRQMLLAPADSKHLSDDIECMCKLLSTIGKVLELNKPPEIRKKIDEYFKKLSQVAQGPQLDARHKFMIRDVADLRRNHWEPRQKVVEAKKIKDIRAEIMQEQMAQRAGPPQNHHDNRRMSRHNQGGNMNAPGSLLPPVAHNLRGPNGGHHGNSGGSMGGSNSGGGPPPGLMVGGMGGGWQTAAGNRRPSGAQKDAPAAAAPQHLGPGGPRLGPGGGFFGKAKTGGDDVRLGPSGPNTGGGGKNMFSALSGGGAEEAPAVKKLTPEQREKKINLLLEEYMGANDCKEAQTCIQELNDPSMHGDLVQTFINFVMEKKPPAQARMAKLLSHMHTTKVFTQKHLLAGINLVLEIVADLQIDIPNAAKFLGEFGGRLALSKAVPLALFVEAVIAAEDLVDSGLAETIYLSVLATIKAEEADKLAEIVDASGVDIKSVFRKSKANNEDVLKTLEAKGLGDVCPLLKVQQHVEEAIKNDKDSKSILAWLSENSNSKVQDDPAFSRLLIRNIIQVVANAGIFKGDGSVEKPNNPDKALLAAEQKLLKQYLPLVENFVKHNAAKQMAAMFELQGMWHGWNYPKGFMERMFESLYQCDVIDERTFYSWRDDDKNTTPGKGKAIIDVNKWLTWLEEADEEESGDDAGADA